MSEKTAKINAILSCRDVNTQNGLIYYYKLEMDNGEVGEIGKKKPDAFKAGDSLTYTSEETQYGLKFKAVQNGSFGGGFNGRAAGSMRGGNESFALSYSKDVICAMIQAGMLPKDVSSADIAKATMATADKFLEWMNEHKS